MRNTNKRLLMTSPYLRYAKRAKEQGFYLIAIWHKNHNKKNISEICKYADEFYMVDIDDTEYLKNLVNFIHMNNPVDYIYHLGRDKHAEIAYEIAESHGKSLNSLETIQIINDKYRMRKFLEQKGLSTVRYKYLETVQDVRHKMETFGFPFILKPTSLTGSIGVLLCSHPEQIDEWERVISEHDYKGPFLMEEYLEGPEVSVEALSLHGKHYIMGITDKIKTKPPLFVELGHVHPSQLAVHMQNEIRSIVQQFLNLTNYQFGPSHTELILTPNGPKIVESHARMGGDQIPDLVHYVTGVNMVENVIKMLNNDEPPIPENSGRVAMISFFQWPSGKIIQLEGIEEVRKLPYVLKLETSFKIGDVVPDLKDSLSRCGFIIVVGNGYEEVAKRSKLAINSIKISTETEVVGAMPYEV